MGHRHPLERLHPRSLKHLSAQLQSLVRGRLWLQVLVGMLLGIGMGVALGPTVGWVEPRAASVIGNWLALPGQIFLGLIQMIVMPLVFASIVRGIAAGEDVRQVRRLGIQASVFFVATTTLAIVIGIGLALLVRPGQYFDPAAAAGLATSTSSPAGVAPGLPSLGSLPEAIAGLLPRNPLGSMVDFEMLQVVLFAAIMGVALVTMDPKRASIILDLLGSLQEACMVVVRWAMWLAPVAVLGLMAQLTAKLGLEALLGMGAYVLTVLGGLFIMLVLQLALLPLLARRSPFVFLRQIRELQLLAFSTSSSAAVMPLSMKTAEERLGVRPSIAQFVIPLGATINMNGTALYQGVATVFLAQVFGIELGVPALALIVVTAVAASIGSPATPGVGIVVLAMVLSAAGIPTAGLGLIIGVDRILDISRTTVNVTGDLVACVLLDHRVGGVRTAGEQLQREENREAERAKTGADVIVGPATARSA